MAEYVFDTWGGLVFGHDGVTADADRVAEELPDYADHVADEVARLGRQHPIVKTQYYLETIDAQGGLLSAQRRALMRGDHARRHDPEPGHRYALLIDVAGEDESPGERVSLQNKKRDATALTVVDVETIGFLKARARARVTGWSGTRMPTVRRFDCSMRGTSLVALKMKV